MCVREVVSCNKVKLNVCMYVCMYVCMFLASCPCLDFGALILFNCQNLISFYYIQRIVGSI